MAEVKLIIPDDKIQLVINAFADTQGYQEFIGQDENGNPIVNSETKAQFTKRMIGEHIRTIVRIYQRKQHENSFTGEEVNIQ